MIAGIELWKIFVLIVGFEIISALLIIFVGINIAYAIITNYFREKERHLSKIFKASAEAINKLLEDSKNDTKANS